MHRSDNEPSEGAAQVVSRGVSTAQKRAMLKAAGEEWPRYTDGTPKVWQRRHDSSSGGSWVSEAVNEKNRAYTRDRNKQAREHPGICDRKGCPEPKQQIPSGTYTPYCKKHNKEYNTRYYADHAEHRRSYSRERSRTSLGWYDAEGMATKPTQFKELT